MTREEQIREAIDKLFPCSDIGRSYEQALGACGFELGVKWADGHPKKAWISVEKDLPCNHKELITPDVFGWTYTQRVLVCLDDGTKEILAMKKHGEGIFEWDLMPQFKVVYWMPIQQVPKPGPKKRVI